MSQPASAVPEVAPPEPPQYYQPAPPQQYQPLPPQQYQQYAPQAQEQQAPQQQRQVDPYTQVEQQSPAEQEAQQRNYAAAQRHAPKTSGGLLALAWISLVLSVVTFWVPSIPMAHIALHKIRAGGTRQGMIPSIIALALGYFWVLVTIISVFHK
ncbi:DUF4190 domain-containing protein [Pseudoclavibacter sp. CFCC 14310]|uniref:DUF4190 domain-containing protein n=1 Tax=Pseudoclavibacter sp. CFCC 14310 TaxID=2615180 RepID=UPI0013014F24|nr:DUF4190 domain-containing protein [Pseudoclavibacter sp. CFCC 14310]KAB1644324.1 DUF4190 domain-containing protein [Pseudoclavibacter sp. CFCC 14310]